MPWNCAGWTGYHDAGRAHADASGGQDAMLEAQSFILFKRQVLRMVYGLV
jgi:hypothetical protein